MRSGTSSSFGWSRRSAFTLVVLLVAMLGVPLLGPGLAPAQAATGPCTVARTFTAAQTAVQVPTSDTCTTTGLTADGEPTISISHSTTLAGCTPGSPGTRGSPCITLLYAAPYANTPAGGEFEGGNTGGANCSFHPLSAGNYYSYYYVPNANGVPSVYTCDIAVSVGSKAYAYGLDLEEQTTVGTYHTYFVVGLNPGAHVGTGAGAPPTASFTYTPASSTPGEYQFVSTSTDPQNETLDYAWDFGDGSSATGATATHAYTKPGTYSASLKVTNTDGRTDTATKSVVVAPPKLEESLTYVDASGAALSSVSPRVGDIVYARLSLDASSDGVGNLNNVTFADAKPLEATPAGAVTIGKPQPVIPAQVTLKPGSAALTYTVPVTIVSTGVVTLTSAATATDDSGHPVTVTPQQESFSVSALTVSLSANPASYVEDEDAKGPKPVDVTVTETITNTTTEPITDLNLRSLEYARVKTGELLNITQTSGPVPTTVGGYPLNPSTLAPGATKTFQAVFTVKDDGEIQFSSLVTGANPAGATVRGLGTTTISAKPKYILGFTSTVATPRNGGLLPAGTPIVIHGTVTNLTDTDTLQVGPLYPVKREGNAGLTSLTYDGVGIDPKLLSNGAATLKLDPGESKDFTVKILTAYSDPRATGGVSRSGGTYAQLTFAPWATATRDDGTTAVTVPADVLSTPDDLVRRVGIDDSIEIPQTSDTAIAGGVLVGGVQGVWNLASGLVNGVINFDKVSYSTLSAASEYQREVWDSFTTAQKDQFAASYTDLVVNVLEANAGLAAEGSATLYAKVKAYSLAAMTELENDWRIGDPTRLAQAYSSFAANTIGQAVMPYALGELAASSDAVTAVDVAQQALQAKLAEIAGRISDARTIEQLGPLLNDLTNATELDPVQVQTLYGITPAELAALQELATRYRYLITVRSRHASSIDWIDTFQAMLKPEAIKIKTVSQLDARLGYSVKAIGSLVFKKPIPLIEFEKTGKAISTLVQDYVESKGFVKGTSEYDDAIHRVADRISEWNKWDKTYQYWSKRGWIDVSFNYKGNAITDSTRTGTGKYAGFRLAKTGEDEYQVQMLNQQFNKFVPVTGDIDPIAFTHLDGTPLSESEHANLLDELAKNPLLKTQHGESATYVDGGKDFIASQFKPNEPGLQLGPNAAAPRVVRFNTTDATVWRSATDYKLTWDGGFTYAGASPDVQGTLGPLDYGTPTEAPAVLEAPSALPGDGAADGENVGRCSFEFSTAPTAQPLEMANGTISQIQGTSITASPLNSTCFSPGPAITVLVEPSTTTTTTTTAGITELPIETAAPAAPSKNGQTGFAIGDTVTIDAGSANAETATISSFGSLIFSKPLKFAHSSGEPVVVTSGQVSNSHSSGPLAATGAGTRQPLEYAVLLIIVGGLFLAAGEIRRRRSTSA